MISLPPGVDIKNLIDNLRILSWEASDILLHYSKILKDSNNKSNIIKNDNSEDPVTIADIKVNQIIIENIKKKYKDINWGILSEENVKLEPHNSDKSADWLWILDPLDGTKDFIQGTSNYAMHLALSYKQKPLLGVVLIPEKEELWITDGAKTWCEKKDGSEINFNPSKNKSLQEMILVTSKNHNNEILKQLIQKTNFSEIIVMGSIGCKIASLIRGDSDIYICLSLPGKTSPKDWDFAAPQSILKAAGGAITNLDNQELSYGQNNFKQEGIIIASNNVSKHMGLLLEIRDIIEKYDIYPL